MGLTTTITHRGFGSRDFFRQIALILLYIIYLSIGILVIKLSWDWFHSSQDKYEVTYYSAATFVLLTIPIATREIYLHLMNWYMPSVQRFVIRILLMAPIYGLESWITLRFRESDIYVVPLRESYEAYVLYSFFHYLIAVLGEEQQLIRILRKRPRSYGEHPKWMQLPCYICCTWKTWQMGRHFLMHCRLGVMQYAILKVAMTVLTIILQVNGVYHSGSLDLTKGYIYVTIVNNFSQMYALYCLVLFYYATSEELERWRPLGKFVFIKAIVFFTFWQSCAIVVLRKIGIIDDIETWTSQEIGIVLENYVICVEMFFAAVASSCVFSYKDYKMNAPDHLLYNKQNPSQMNNNAFFSMGDGNNGNNNVANGNNNNHHNMNNNGNNMMMMGGTSSTRREVLLNNFLDSALPKELYHDITSVVQNARRNPSTDRGGKNNNNKGVNSSYSIDGNNTGSSRSSRRNSNMSIDLELDDNEDDNQGIQFCDAYNKEGFSVINSSDNSSNNNNNHDHKDDEIKGIGGGVEYDVNKYGPDWAHSSDAFRKIMETAHNSTINTIMKPSNSSNRVGFNYESLPNPDESITNSIPNNDIGIGSNNIGIGSKNNSRNNTRDDGTTVITTGVIINGNNNNLSTLPSSIGNNNNNNNTPPRNLAVPDWITANSNDNTPTRSSPMQQGTPSKSKGKIGRNAYIK